MDTIEKCLSSTQDKIIEISRKNENQNILLAADICIRYDVVAYRKKIMRLFRRLLEKRYLSPEENIKVTSNYQENSHRNTPIHSAVEISVDSYIDSMLYENDVCQTLLVLATKFTFEEGIYFVYTFSLRKSEDDISNILKMSRTTLQKIKKSCIVKSWFELKKYCEDE